MRILWASDCITPTGYGRVANELIPRLQSYGHDISVIAVNYHGDPHNLPIKAYPASAGNASDPFGFNRTIELTLKTQPDVFFILNDPWHVANYIDILDKHLGHKRPAVVAYTPIDAKNYTHASLPRLNSCEGLITYTQFSKNEMIRGGVTRNIAIVPHGINLNDFQVYDKNEARKLLQIDPNHFIVFNYNKNQMRKNLPLTIEGFLHFAVKAVANGANAEDLVLLLLHIKANDQSGWNIIDVFNNAKRDICPNLNVKIATVQPEPHERYISQEKLNYLLSAVDIGINTASAGGWELTCMEGARFGVPQVVLDNSCMGEIWNKPYPQWANSKYKHIPGAGIAVKTAYYQTLSMFSVKHAYSMPEDVGDALYSLYSDKELYKEMSRRASILTKQPEFNWDNIAKQINEEIIKAFKGSPVPELKDWTSVMEKLSA